MPPATNDFQELITVLTQISGKDAVVTASEPVPDLAVPGATREVDIWIRVTGATHEVLIGVECRMSGSGPQSVEWVEQMHGKHSHLPTNKLVLVSSSGFSKNAWKLAEALKIKAIQPTEVEPGFVGEIVNNLDTVWVKLFDFTPETMTATYDPPITHPDGYVEDTVDLTQILNTGLHRADNTLICTAGQFLDARMRNINLDQPAFRDFIGEEDHFTLHLEGPHLSGEPIFLMGGLGPEPPNTLRRVTKVEIVGKLAGQVAEMPLKHGQYDGTPYSTGTVTMGDRSIHWAVTEGAEGKQIGARVSPTDQPTKGVFVQGKGPSPGDG